MDERYSRDHIIGGLRKLTPRLYELLRLRLLLGKSAKQIADEFVVDIKTIHRYSSLIYTALNFAGEDEYTQTHFLFRFVCPIVEEAEKDPTLIHPYLAQNADLEEGAFVIREERAGYTADTKKFYRDIPMVDPKDARRAVTYILVVLVTIVVLVLIGYLIVVSYLPT